MGPHLARTVTFLLLTRAAVMWSQHSPAPRPAPQVHTAIPHTSPQIGRTGHWPSWTPAKNPERHHLAPGIGYAGYPWLAPFAYSTLPLVYDTSDGEEQPEAPQPQTHVEYGVPPPENYPQEVAENIPTPFRPAYGGSEPDPQPATVLIFLDGRPPVEVHNYAVIGDTLFGLDSEARQEIPLSQLNLPATVGVNRKAGVDFSLPQK